MNDEFIHPIGTKVWWVGMDFVSDVLWVIRERKVVACRTTTWEDCDKPLKQIFVSGLTSYEGENWFDDEYQTMKEFDTDWHCSCFDGDCLFDTLDEAQRYYELKIKETT